MTRPTWAVDPARELAVRYIGRAKVPARCEACHAIDQPLRGLTLPGLGPVFACLHPIACGNRARRAELGMWSRAL